MYLKLRAVIVMIAILSGHKEISCDLTSDMHSSTTQPTRLLIP
jgi:hypothetical protein